MPVSSSKGQGHVAIGGTWLVLGQRSCGCRRHLAGVVQILTKLETFVPIDLLLKMFDTGIRSLRRLSKSLAVRNEEHSEEPPVNNAETPPPAAAAADDDDDDEEGEDDVPNLKCFIMMLDILLKQVLT